MEINFRVLVVQENRKEQRDSRTVTIRHWNDNTCVFPGLIFPKFCFRKSRLGHKDLNILKNSEWFWFMLSSQRRPLRNTVLIYDWTLSVARDINSSHIYLSKSSRTLLIQVVEMFRSLRLKRSWTQVLKGSHLETFSVSWLCFCTCWLWLLICY